MSIPNEADDILDDEETTEDEWADIDTNEDENFVTES